MPLIRIHPRRLLLVALACVVMLLTTGVAAVAASTPAKPTAFTATGGVGKVSLSWHLPKGVVAVDVKRNGVIVVKNLHASKWSSTSVRNDVTYKYAIRGVNSRGKKSAWTTAKAVTPLAAPPAPTGVVLRNQDSQVMLTWNKPTSALASTVRVLRNGYRVATVPASVGTAVVANLVNERSYLLTVQTVNRNGSTSKSVYLTAVPTAAQQRSPFGLTVAGGNARVDLDWLPTVGAQRYLLYRNGKYLRTVNAPTTSSADTGLDNGVTFQYQVQVVVAGQSSALSPMRAATPLAPPASPESLAASARDSAAALTWQTPAGSVAAYELRRDGVAVADLPGTATSYTDTGLRNGTTYQYTLIAINANQAAGPASSPAAVVPAPAPPAPSVLAAAVGDSQVTLSWTATNGITRWQLLRDGLPLGGVLTDTRFVDTSALNDVTYSYALVAVGADDQQSTPSPTVSATPRAIPPAVPAGVSTDTGDSEVTVSWDMPVPAPARFRVYRDGALVAETTSSPVRDGALDNGTAYHYTVTALDGRGVESGPSQAVTATPASPGADAPGLRVVSGHEEAVLSFTEAAGHPATGWRVLRDGVEVRSGTGAEMTVRELTDGRAYRFQVQAMYGDGSGSALSAVSVAVPKAPWRGLAVGAGFACGVHVDGGVRCWGANDGRQLGDGSTVAFASGPVVVTGPAGVTRVAAGDRHACAATGNGAVWCWGAAPGSPAVAPAVVPTLSGVTALAAGGATTCAVAAGSVWCFGDGSSGQLGGPASSATPVKVTLPAAAVDVAVGRKHACAVLADATLACWGADDKGQRSGSVSAVRTVARVAGLTGVSAVSAGADHTCVLSGAAVSCFGAGDAGQLGRPATSPAPAAVDVPNAVAVSAGNRYTCVTLLSGQARCFGAGGSGQLGDGAGRDRSSPVSVLNLDSATSVVAGAGDTSCTLTRDGSVWCFGANGSGQVGSGTTQSQSQPSESIVGLDGATRIAMGADASCMVRDSGVWCWGPNRLGAAGVAAGVPVPVPTRVALPAGAVARSVAVGGATACANTIVNELYCWGANGSGQAGQPVAATVGVGKVALTSVSDVVVGPDVTCARKGGGTLWCFGVSGLLGAGLTGTQPHPDPAQVLTAPGVGLTGIALIAAGDRHVCAVNQYSVAVPQSGAVWCFGDPSGSRLGAPGSGALATQVPGLAAVTSVGAGRAHTCAVSLAPSRALWCFGANGAGQLGLGDTTDRSAPAAVPNMTPSKVVAGGDVTCVKSPNAQGWCFGASAAGQTGNGLLRAAEPVPQVVYNSDGILPAAAFATNGATSCAQLATGAVSCWGARLATSYGEGVAFGYPAVPVLD
ncbi:fibronectin type III domain-containing protein [Krasilnikovia sp. M28-CT-15]|uniref:fibronectin type III domain-containing protein n=1 Tax=Krasilnikovia sp. M28-CT-15 TaxID=3373540 RepID=UPI003876C7F3